MKRDRQHLFVLIFRFVWVASIAFVAYLSLSPNVELNIQIRNIDKLYHALAYAWLAAIPFLGFQHLKPAFAGAFLMVPFGIGMEYAQRLFAHGRFFSLGDMIANIVGVILGVCLGMFLKSRFISRFEAKPR